MDASFLVRSRLVVAGFLVIAGVSYALGQGTKEKTAGEDRKNIVVLKTLPASRLNPVMDLMASSLGVRCQHCHFADSSGTHFERDDKPEKRTARKMIQMVMDLNSRSFGGRPVITCYTCHHGSVEPAEVLPLPAQPAKPENEKEKESASLPTVDQVLASYEKALGGSDAIRKITSRITKGSSIDAEGHAMSEEIVQKAPGLFLSTVTFREGMQRKRGFDGKVGWFSTPRGIREIPAERAGELRRGAELFPLSGLREKSSALHVREKDTLNGKDVYVLAAPAGDDVTELYSFDVATGLLVREMTVTETPVGIIPTQIDYTDYRPVDGVKIPFSVRSSAPDPRDESTLRITSVEQNVKVDEKQFSPPAEKKK